MQKTNHVHACEIIDCDWNADTEDGEKSPVCSCVLEIEFHILSLCCPFFNELVLVHTHSTHHLSTFLLLGRLLMTLDLLFLDD